MNIRGIEYERSGIILPPAARLTSRADEMPWAQGLHSDREDQKRRDKLNAQMLACWTQSADAETLLRWVCLLGKSAR